jgi:hypothetical protein
MRPPGYYHQSDARISIAPSSALASFVVPDRHYSHPRSAWISRISAKYHDRKARQIWRDLSGGRRADRYRPFCTIQAADATLTLTAFSGRACSQSYAIVRNFNPAAPFIYKSFQSSIEAKYVRPVSGACGPNRYLTGIGNLRWCRSVADGR